MADDLYVRDGSSFWQPEVPEENKEAEQKDKSKVQDSKPFIKQTIQWFDQQADECDRISALDKSSKYTLDEQVHAYQLLAELLQRKKGEYQSFMAEIEREK